MKQFIKKEDVALENYLDQLKKTNCSSSSIKQFEESFKSEDSLDKIHNIYNEILFSNISKNMKLLFSQTGIPSLMHEHFEQCIITELYKNSSNALMLIDKIIIIGGFDRLSSLESFESFKVRWDKFYNNQIDLDAQLTDTIVTLTQEMSLMQESLAEPYKPYEPVFSTLKSAITLDTDYLSENYDCYKKLMLLTYVDTTCFLKNARLGHDPINKKTELQVMTELYFSLGLFVTESLKQSLRYDEQLAILFNAYEWGIQSSTKEKLDTEKKHCLQYHDSPLTEEQLKIKSLITSFNQKHQLLKARLYGRESEVTNSDNSKNQVLPNTVSCQNSQTVLSSKQYKYQEAIASSSLQTEYSDRMLPATKMRNEKVNSREFDDSKNTTTPYTALYPKKDDSVAQGHGIDLFNKEKKRPFQDSYPQANNKPISCKKIKTKDSIGIDYFSKS